VQPCQTALVQLAHPSQQAVHVPDETKYPISQIVQAVEFISQFKQGSAQYLSFENPTRNAPKLAMIKIIK